MVGQRSSQERTALMAPIGNDIGCSGCDACRPYVLQDMPSRDQFNVSEQCTGFGQQIEFIERCLPWYARLIYTLMVGHKWFWSRPSVFRPIERDARGLYRSWGRKHLG